MATFISNSIAGNNCYLIVCCLRTNNSNLFSSNSLLRKKKSTFLFFLSYSFPTYCILSVRNVKFYSLLNSSFIYKGKKKLSWVGEIKTLNTRPVVQPSFGVPSRALWRPILGKSFFNFPLLRGERGGIEKQGRD